jgi:transposase-like protein
MNQKSKKVKRNPFPQEIVNLPIKECPHCGSRHFIKFGKYVNVSRYRCKACRRTFIPTSGSSIHYINKKETFLRLFDMFNSGEVLTIKNISQKFGISILTAFDWRHKIFLALQLVKQDFESFTIANKVVFYFNEKGRKSVSGKRKKFKQKVNLCSITDSRLTEFKFINIGDNIRKDFYERFSGRVGNRGILFFKDDENILIDDIKILNKEKNNPVKLKRLEKSLKIHKYKSEEFKVFINRFMRGVATKYLQVYANFYSFLQSLKSVPDYYKLLEMRLAWIKYLKMEVLYQDFFQRNSLSMNDYVAIKRKWKSNNIRFKVDFEENLINNYT